MSITASRNVQVQFSGDVTFNLIQSALDNTTSVAVDMIIPLSSGNNSITPPVISGLTLTALTIIPPAGNVNVITLKGVNGDTGVPLHVTDPTTIALDVSFTGLVLSAANSIVGVRLIWS